MKNIFNSVEVYIPRSNVFSIPCDKKLSFNMGELVPVHLQECIPGDRITMGTDALLRLAPLVSPVMGQMDVFIHHWFVAKRLVWANWETFMTGGQDPSIMPAYPFLEDLIVEVGSLSDHMGLPIADATTDGIDKIGADAHAAYQMIYQEWYRDQNLIEDVDYKLIDGDNSANTDLTVLRKRAWEHDYFTAALPWAQKGPAVEIPIGEFTDVDVFYSNPTFANTAIVNSNPGIISAGGNTSLLSEVPGGGANYGRFADGALTSVAYDPNGTLKAETSTLSAEAATINNLRVAEALQRWMERNARGGSRYAEYILHNFGVRSSDSRLQRPNYLGGSKQPMIISEVLQTSESSETPQGNMSGHGVSAGSGKAFRYFCEEHGWIISIISVMPKPVYQQGIPKHFKKFDRMEFADPIFAHLGEQEVKNYELYYESSTPNTNNETFGYLPRYAEYRYNPSTVSGEFRTNLAFWTLSRIFASRPGLNQQFIEMDYTELDRIFAVTDPDSDRIYAHIYHRIKAVRKLPLFGTPIG